MTQFLATTAIAELLGLQQRQRLTLSERQVTPRRRGDTDRCHPACLTKPTWIQRL